MKTSSAVVCIFIWGISLAAAIMLKTPDILYAAVPGTILITIIECVRICHEK